MNCWLNIVNINKPKLLKGLNQKVSGAVAPFRAGCALTIVSTGVEAGPNPSVCYLGGTW